jgi:hypothetical protein
MDPVSGPLAQVGAQASVTPLEFVYQLAGAALASAALAALYVRFGRSAGNRRALAALFVPLTITTMFVIAVVKSSLALSLGLVGALSIVRFRTAIREPEELIYLFVCIGLGLGFGAKQWMIVSIAFVAVALCLIVLALMRKSIEKVGAQWLLVQIPKASDVSVDRLTATVAQVARRAKLTRYDAKASGVEATFDLELEDPANAVARLVAAVRGLAPDARCLVVDHPQRPPE